MPTISVRLGSIWLVKLPGDHHVSKVGVTEIDNPVITIARKTTCRYPQTIVFEQYEADDITWIKEKHYASA